MENMKKTRREEEEADGDALQEAFESEKGPEMGLMRDSETPAFQSQLAPPYSLSALRRWQGLDPRERASRAKQRLLRYLYHTLSSSELAFEKCTDLVWKSAVWYAVADMIECERAAWDLDYFVFYWVVSGKYLLYEFNTLNRRLASFACRACSRQRIPIPSRT